MRNAPTGMCREITAPPAPTQADAGGLIDACPYCGSDTFYRKARFSGKGRINERFDGVCADNTEMYDSIEAKVSKTRWCLDCDKRIPAAPPSNQPTRTK